MIRPLESDYTSQVAYTRALEAYCDSLAQPEQKPVAWEQFYPDIGKPQIAINSVTVGYVAPQLKIEGSRHVICQCDKCKAQPEQGPVAWWNDTGTHIDLNVSGRGAPLYTTPPQQEPQNFCPRCGKRTADLTAIHTCTPPQRTWVGLTDDEFDKIYDQHIPTEDYAESMAMVAAKLKEKNT